MKEEIKNFRRFIEDFSLFIKKKIQKVKIQKL